MAPQCPGNFVDFRMPGLRSEIGEGFEKNFFRAPSWIKPQLRCARRRVDLFVLHVIARTPERAVPLPRERLPMQIGSRCRAFDGRRRARAMLMHDDAAKGF